MPIAGRVVAEVAATHGVSWWTVQKTVTADADALTDPDTIVVRRLGVDEHRYRSVQFFRAPEGASRRSEPWRTTLVDADTGRVLGVVDGRDSAAVGAWLAARSPAWRAAVEVVPIHPSAAFRRALREQLPRAAVSAVTLRLERHRCHRRQDDPP